MIRWFRKWLRRQDIVCFVCGDFHQVEGEFFGFKLFVCDKLEPGEIGYGNVI